MRLALSIAVAFFALAVATRVSAQMTSMGPGKGPATPGNKSKYTYPQPPKPQPVQLSAMQPGAQIPENPEKYIWKLTGKMYGREGATPSNKVPVFSFSYSGQIAQVGMADAGEIITLDEVRQVGRSLLYKFAWTGSASKERFGPTPQFWVNGSNIEFAGTK